MAKTKMQKFWPVFRTYTYMMGTYRNVRCIRRERDVRLALGRTRLSRVYRGFGQWYAGITGTYIGASLCYYTTDTMCKGSLPSAEYVFWQPKPLQLLLAVYNSNDGDDNKLINLIRKNHPGPRQSFCFNVYVNIVNFGLLEAHVTFCELRFATGRVLNFAAGCRLLNYYILIFNNNNNNIYTIFVSVYIPTYIFIRNCGFGLSQWYIYVYCFYFAISLKRSDCRGGLKTFVRADSPESAVPSPSQT